MELNEAAADDSLEVFQFVEKKRLWLFWNFEAAVIILGN